MREFAILKHSKSSCWPIATVQLCCSLHIDAGMACIHSRRGGGTVLVEGPAIMALRDSQHTQVIDKVQPQPSRLRVMTHEGSVTQRNLPLKDESDKRTLRPIKERRQSRKRHSIMEVEGDRYKLSPFFRAQTAPSPFLLPSHSLGLLPPFGPEGGREEGKGTSIPVHFLLSNTRITDTARLPAVSLLRLMTGEV